MTTELERIAVKARKEPKLRFTSLAHHLTGERVWRSLCHIPRNTSPGCDGKTVEEEKETFGEWIEPMLRSVHHKGYRPPPIRRVYIPKPGKQEKRPLGVPCVADRALQRSVSEILSAIYEQDFLPCSFGGRRGLGAHNALGTLTEVIAGKKVGWVLEADLKNFFGSLDHGWLLRFVEHRVGDPRLISLIRRWLKAGVLEDGEVYPNDEGTPQGGSMASLLVSHIVTEDPDDSVAGYSLDREFGGVRVLRRDRDGPPVRRWLDYTPTMVSGPVIQIMAWTDPDAPTPPPNWGIRPAPEERPVVRPGP